MNIETLQLAIGAGKIRVTDHADEELAADGLLLNEVLQAVLVGEIIEDYPSDRPLPSCLLLGLDRGGAPIHSVWAYNDITGLAVLVTIVSTRSAGSTAAQGENNMPSDPNICPVCGGQLVNKQVEKLLRGGVHTAVIQVRADVCQRCGERLYPAETIRHFEDIRHKLAHHQTAEFTPLGQSFQAV